MKTAECDHKQAQQGDHQGRPAIYEAGFVGPK